MVYNKVVTNKSPWLKGAVIDEVYAVPVSHGEGRFVASDEWIEKLFKNGQVATQYVNLKGMPTMDIHYNPNGSYYAIEGIISPDGRILGKMGHSERMGEYVAKNIYVKQNMRLFRERSKILQIKYVEGITPDASRRRRIPYLKEKLKRMVFS